MKRLVFLLLILALLFIPLQPSLGLVGNVVFVAPDEWLHLSLDAEPIESMVWLSYGEDIQVAWFAYNDSSVQFDSFVITPNQTFTDPFNKFSFLWQGNFGVLGEIVLTVSSPLGAVTTLLNKFEGEVPRYGKPPMTVQKTVITEEARLYDVIVDDIHVATFEWSFVTLSSNTTGSNQTFPELSVYNSDGTDYDTRVLTSTFVPLVDYYDIVGWMVSTMTSNYVKWVLYAGEAIQVRTSMGFTVSPLPFFVIYPKSLQISSGEPVTIRYRLPEGVKDFTASWSDTYSQRYLDVLSEDFNPSNGEHEVQITFYDNAEGRKFRLEVEVEKYGTTYRSGERITVIAPAWKTMGLPLFGGLILLGVAVLVIILAIRRRLSPPDPQTAIEKVLIYAPR